jgi:hypothetical protein
VIVMPDNKPETDWHQIQMLAAVLMAGFIEKLDEGRPQRRYLDSKHEDRHRAAMARLLRSGLPLTQDFRDQLAALFDPNAGTHPAIDRKLIFKYRSRGRRRDNVRNTAVAQYIFVRIREGDGVEKAQQKAADFFCLSFEAVRDIWGHKEGEGFRRLIPLIDGSPEVVK